MRGGFRTRGARAAAAAVAAVAAVTAAAPGEARADTWRRAAERVQGGAWLHYELTGLTTVDGARAAGGEGTACGFGGWSPRRGDGSAPGACELVLAGARLHGFLGTNASVAYHIGMDLAAGGTIRGGGFAYDVALFPVGVVVRGGETSVFAVGAGVGFIGATGTIDDAVTIPVEVIAEVGGGRRLLARVRWAYVAGAASRQSAAPSIAFADELDATLGLRLGRRYRDHGFPMGNGYFVGASYRELADARFLGLTIGYSIDLAMPRRWVSERAGGDGDSGSRRTKLRRLRGRGR